MDMSVTAAGAGEADCAVSLEHGTQAEVFGGQIGVGGGDVVLIGAIVLIVPTVHTVKLIDQNALGDTIADKFNGLTRIGRKGRGSLRLVAEKGNLTDERMEEAGLDQGRQDHTFIRMDALRIPAGNTSERRNGQDTQDLHQGMEDRGHRSGRYRRHGRCPHDCRRHGHRP